MAFWPQFEVSYDFYKAGSRVLLTVINTIASKSGASCITVFSGPHFRLPRFDSPLTTPSEVKINGRRILPVINY